MELTIDDLRIDGLIGELEIGRLGDWGIAATAQSVQSVNLQFPNQSVNS
jgi:hypothetical protein